ncbi:sigma-54-dependent Fis family transcriptional regulator [Pacificimonas sp. WHA3]|uniref:Sigma-54-dependent Fis family transcriptional regulator n=1 Tax=Pacificimonas pallii TaxID=2827236 RepID=A0ABS6SEC4_9SPHN|nr:sigma-54 dependent transcriptional regulator [Pacificimonas pallii]MBV7256701.1 sigma-54-dependent Fis family transcriptional regulator [Pacificimonas pallii]
MALDILVIDDEKDIRDLVAGVLEDEGYEARTAGNSDDAIAAITERRPALVVLDVWLQGSRLDGIELLDEIKQRDPMLPVIIISGHGNIETAVAAIKRGAYDFIEKPFQADALLLTISRATETERLRRENEELRSRAGVDTELTGDSAALANVRATLKRVAPTGSRVLIEGPPGSGKEVAARLLHIQSARAAGPFVTVSCARLHPDRVEEALFGVEDGANGTRVGLFEQAHGGTLFLDEVADMPLTTQGKILRVLTDQVFVRVNGTRPVQVDVRVISSTSRDLAIAIAEQTFREDLYYRLAVVPLAMPSLEDRREDILPLANHFLARFATERGLPTPTLSDDAAAALQSYEWPGNIRQLRNVIERVLILAPPESVRELDSSALPQEIVQGASDIVSGDSSKSIMGSPLREARESFEREYLRVQIKRFSGNISRTAAFVGMERSALHRKLKALQLGDAAHEERKD